MPYIDGLPTAASASGADVLPINQGSTGVPGSGTTRQISVTDLFADAPPISGDDATFENLTITEGATVPTLAPGTSTAGAATTAFVGAAVGVETTRAEAAEGALATAVATETTRAETAEALLAPKASPALTGTPTAPTAAANTATTQIATTAYAKLGVTDGSNAPAGQIGEYLSATTPSSAPIPLTSAVAANVVSLALTAGDWSVAGEIVFVPAAGCSPVGLSSAFSTTSATIPAAPGGGYVSLSLPGAFPAGTFQAFAPGSVRVSLSAPATVYLVGSAGFTSSTMSAYGFIGARRMR